MLNKTERKQLKIADGFYWSSSIFLGVISFLGMHIIPDNQLFTLWGLWFAMTIIYSTYVNVMFKRYHTRKKWKKERTIKRKKYAKCA